MTGVFSNLAQAIKCRLCGVDSLGPDESPMVADRHRWCENYTPERSCSLNSFPVWVLGETRGKTEGAQFVCILGELTRSEHELDAPTGERFGDLWGFVAISLVFMDLRIKNHTSEALSF